MPEKQDFQLGLVMAGAISAGAYSAGVVDFFIEALNAYEAERNKPDWTGPTHDVRIPVLSGASAGGMTAAIGALHAFYGLTSPKPKSNPPPNSENRLYSSWVTDISIEELLATTDLDSESGRDGVKSALCCDVLRVIVNKAFNIKGRLAAPNWIGRDTDRSLRVMFTLTNMRGVPYAFSMFGSSANRQYGMLNHGDYLDFTVSSGPPQSLALGSHLLDLSNPDPVEQELFKTAALATGAFPIGLAARGITRPAGDYHAGQLVGYEDLQTQKFITIPPFSGVPKQGAYPFVAVDGGTIDNEPLELARRFLANFGHNEQDGVSAKKAVVLVAPFPNFASVPEPDDDDRLVHIVRKLLSTLIEQARFKSDELAKAANDKIFSRFMITPIRPAGGNKLAVEFPIASGTLNGFGGFLHKSFRRHDYLLGRRNAQAFLRWNFALPIDNSLFEEYRSKRKQEDIERWYVKEVEGAVGSISRADEINYNYKLKKFAKTSKDDPDSVGLPIIPLTDELCKPIEIGGGDLPKPDAVDRDDLKKRIQIRAEAVIDKLLSQDLKQLTEGWTCAWLVRREARKYLTEIAVNKSNDYVKDAVKKVRGAFPP